jgi:hypothetical protein
MHRKAMPCGAFFGKRMIELKDLLDLDPYYFDLEIMTTLDDALQFMILQSLENSGETV